MGMLLPPKINVPPPPPPPPAANPPTVANAAVQAAGQMARARASGAQGQGLNGTDLTGPGGASAVSTTKAQLLGGTSS